MSGKSRLLIQWIRLHLADLVLCWSGVEEPAGFFLEGGTDQVHARHLFDGAQQVDSTAVWPPAVAGFFHKGKTVQAFPGLAGRAVAADIAPACFKTQQGKPVFHPGQADECGIDWQEMVASHPSPTLPDSPEAGRVESTDDDLAFRNQYPVDFTQELMGGFCQVKGMGQCHEVYGFCVKRQLSIGMGQGNGDGMAVQPLECIMVVLVGICHVISRQEGVRIPVVGDAVFFQGVEFGQSDLDGVESENVFGKCPEIGFFPAQHVLSGW